MSYDVAFNILVNGNRCKQYHHNGKIWIEAKHGSEYEIEIKNNSWSRILAVSSVDGLNVISGKAEDFNVAGGYVISPYSSERIDGFRYEDNKVAKFKFTCKGNSYAASKGDNSERNSGVIGLRVFDEVPKPVVIVQQQVITTQPPWTGTPAPQPWTPYYMGGITGSLGGTPNLDLQNMVEDYYTPVEDMYDHMIGNIEANQVNINYCAISGKGMSSGAPLMRSAKKNANSRQYSAPVEKFDMGTAWGESKYSPTVKVDFEKKSLVLGVDIFYASRESLIEMGVPITTHRMVNQTTPESFPSTYAKPPAGWRG